MAEDPEYDLRSVTEWGERWLVSFNASKTKLLSINKYKNPNLPPISMLNESFPESYLFTFWIFFFLIPFLGMNTLNLLLSLLP